MLLSVSVRCFTLTHTKVRSAKTGLAVSIKAFESRVCQRVFQYPPAPLSAGCLVAAFLDRAATTPTSGYAWTNHTDNGETRWTFISMEVRAILRTSTCSPATVSGHELELKAMVDHVDPSRRQCRTPTIGSSDMIILHKRMDICPVTQTGYDLTSAFGNIDRQGSRLEPRRILTIRQSCNRAYALRTVFSQTDLMLYRHPDPV